MTTRNLVFTFLLVVALSSFVSSSSIRKKTQWFDLENGYSFEDYVREYSKIYSSPEEYERRKEIFEQKLSLIKEHNRDGTKTWKKGVNHLTDRTDQEYRKLLGYDKVQGFSSWLKRNKDSNKNRNQPTPQAVQLPHSMDWRSQGVVSAVKDQGECGSCWSFGSAETLESYWALATGNLQVLSEQQILDCTPNTNECGGTGGCGGGTVEIAFDKIMDMGGLSSEWTYPYQSWSGNNLPNCSFDPSRIQAHLPGYVSLPPNEYDPVMHALATMGPLAINVDASAWGDYEGGVFDGCNMTSPDINHVVQLVGYGSDFLLGDYWLVRNSWTPSFGEAGYIRIARSPTVVCGTDSTPLDGTGCKGGPSEVQVCGPCGILFDVIYVSI